MSLPLEDYALLGDCHTAALVSRRGGVDWMCQPRFDSNACFAALLGDDEHGTWRIAPGRDGFDEDATVSRAYRDDTLVLETVFEVGDGQVAIVDFMPPRMHEHTSSLVRIVEGRRGRVAMRGELMVRFNYGLTTPWVTKCEEGNSITAIAGPDRITLRAPVELRGEDMKTVSTFEVDEGERVVFVLSYNPSHHALPQRIDVDAELARTVDFWERWACQCLGVGERTHQVRRSLMVLKALTYAPTGGIVAAPTTSLPEQLGGIRNWDYRYCWLRDSVITLFALMNAGYYEESKAWRMWLERAVAGDSKSLRIMYGVAGERRLDEWSIDELPGYADSRPVRIGNAASDQLQLDVYGQLMASLHQARIGGIAEDETIWSFQLHALEHLANIWETPDQSIWETRGDPQHFVFSKVMTWTAFASAIASAERFGLEGPLDRWRALRDQVHAEICEKGFDAKRNTFVQAYGSQALDASALLLPFVGFLPIDDPRMAGTIAAIERELVVDGFVLRYSTTLAEDGLPPGEGAFLACSFWLASVMYLQGRVDESHALFDRIMALANDVGLLAEEYDPRSKRMVGNFPQAFSHVGLVNAAMILEDAIPKDRRLAEMLRTRAGPAREKGG